MLHDHDPDMTVDTSTSPAFGGPLAPPQPSHPCLRPNRPENHGELPRAESEARVHHLEHRLPLQRRRRHLGLLREGAVLGLGARDAAGVPHCQHLSRPLAGCVRGGRAPPVPPRQLGSCPARGCGAGGEAAGPALPPGSACSFFLVCQPHFPRQKEDSIIVGTSTGATFQFQLLPVKIGSLEKRWVRTKPFQHHTHDVRAVAHSSTALISGGRTGRSREEGWGLSPRCRLSRPPLGLQAWTPSW